MSDAPRKITFTPPKPAYRLIQNGKHSPIRKKECLALYITLKGKVQVEVLTPVGLTRASIDEKYIEYI